MNALQVYAILNKRIKGLVSGIQSAVVNGTTITFTMNDGSTQTMTFPTPADGKDGTSVVNIEIKDVTSNGNTEKHLIFTMSDGSIIDSGKIDGTGGGVVQKNSQNQFPKTGETDTLYLAKDTEKLFYWNGIKYQAITPDATQVLAELETAKLEFDGISDTFELPIDDISYNVFVNGIYYTESEDYTIDKTTSPNKIIFNDIYDTYESCTLTYLKPVNPSGSSGGDCSCEDHEYATKEDIDELFKNTGDDGAEYLYAVKSDIDKMFEEGGSDAY